MKRVVYYHIAAMNNWREVAVEQLSLLAKNYSGLVRVGLLAGVHEKGFLWHLFKCFPNLKLEVVHHVEGLGQFEFPTLLHLEKSCRENEVEEVVYFHSKGVSHLGDWKSMQWRWLMNVDVVGGASAELGDFDVVGSSWCDHYCPRYPHFAGNFWIAKSAFIRGLESLESFKNRFMQDPSRHHWMTVRHAAELWLGTSLLDGVKPLSKRGVNQDIGGHDFYASRPELQRELLLKHIN